MPNMTYSATHLKDTLQGFLSEDKVVRDKCNEEIRTGPPQFVLPYLITSISNAQLDYDVRRLAAVLLRKQISTNFTDLKDPATQELVIHLRSSSLEIILNQDSSLTQEQNFTLHKLTVDIIYQLVSLGDNAESWPGPWELIQKWLKEPQINPLALHLIARLSGVPFAISVLSNPSMDLVAALHRALSQPSIRSTALRTICDCVIQAEKSGAVARSLAPLASDMGNVLKLSNETEDFQKARDLTEKTPKIWNSIPFIDTLSGILADPSRPSDIRAGSIKLLSAYMVHSKDSTMKTKTGKQDIRIGSFLMDTIYQCQLHRTEQEFVDLIETQEETLDAVAVASAGEMLQAHLSIKQDILACTANALKEPTWQFNLAALIMLKEVVERGDDQDNNTGFSIELIGNMLGFCCHHEARVRFLSYQVLIATYDRSHLSDTSATPLLTKSLEVLTNSIKHEKTYWTRTEGLSALLSLLAILSDEDNYDAELDCSNQYPLLAPFVDNLLHHTVISSLELPGAPLEMQSLALNIATAIAQTCGKHFGPYFEPFMLSCRRLIETRSPDERVADSAIECFGEVCKTINPRDWPNHISWAIATCAHLIKTGTNVTPALTALSSIIAKLKIDFLSFLPVVLPSLTELAFSHQDYIEAGNNPINLTSKEKELSAQIDENTGLASIHYTDSHGNTHAFTIDSKAAEEKQLAVDLVRQICRTFPSSVGAPLAEAGCKALLADLSSSLSFIRTAAFEAYPALIFCMLYVAPPDPSRLSQAFRAFLRAIAEAINTRELTEVATTIIPGLRDILEVLSQPFPPPKETDTPLTCQSTFSQLTGHVFPDPSERHIFISDIFNILATVLKRTHGSGGIMEKPEVDDDWQNISDNDDDIEEGEENPDSLMFDATMQCAANLFRVYGKACEEAFELSICGMYVEFLRSEERDRNAIKLVASICAFGEALKVSSDNFFVRYGDMIFDVANRYAITDGIFTDEEHNVLCLQAAAFTLCVIAASPQVHPDRRRSVVQTMEKLLGDPKNCSKDRRAAMDCIVNGLFRLWLMNPDGMEDNQKSVQFAVELISKWLPLEVDEDEQQECHKAVVASIYHQTQLGTYLIANHKPHVRKIVEFLETDKMALSPFEWGTLREVAKTFL